MEVTILSQEKSMATIRITLPGEPLTVALNDAYKIYLDKKPENPIAREDLATDPGAQDMYRTAIQDVFSDNYAAAIAQTGLTVASQPMIRVLRADESLGLEFELEFAVRPELKLGQYKGLRVKMPDLTLSEEEFQTALAAAEAQNTVQKTVDRPAALGDTTVIDFTGYLNGEAFQGGAGTDYPLVLGSGSFIPGFEDQLVGASAGQEVEVKVTFPENYGAPNLAGQAAIFRCTVKSVQATEHAPLTDSQKAQLRKQAEQAKKNQADQAIEDEVLTRILTEAQCEIPEAMLESEVNICLDQFASELQSKGMSVESFMQQTGKTWDAMAAEMRPLANRRIMLRLVLSAIAEAEGITATDEEVDARWDEMAVQYGMDKATLKAYAGEGSEEQIRTEVAASKAYALLRDSTILEQ